MGSALTLGVPDNRVSSLTGSNFRLTGRSSTAARCRNLSAHGYSAFLGFFRTFAALESTPDADCWAASACTAFSHCLVYSPA